MGIFLKAPDVLESTFAMLTCWFEWHAEGFDPSHSRRADAADSFTLVHDWWLDHHAEWLDASHSRRTDAAGSFAFVQH